MTEEVKNGIKEVLAEAQSEMKDTLTKSLIEALQEHQTKKEKSVLDLFLIAVQICLVPLIGWLLLNSVEIQKDIVLLRVQVAQANEHLVEHMAEVEDTRASNVILHHSAAMPDCGACHSITEVKIPTSVKKKIQDLGKNITPKPFGDKKK